MSLITLETTLRLEFFHKKQFLQISDQIFDPHKILPNLKMLSSKMFMKPTSKPYNKNIKKE